MSQFQDGVWTLGTTVCDGLMTMDVMLCTASIFNLCAISIDRSVRSCTHNRSDGTAEKHHDEQSTWGYHLNQWSPAFSSPRSLFNSKLKPRSTIALHFMKVTILSKATYNKCINHDEQQESRKYNFFKKAKLQSAISECHLSATKLFV